MKEQDGVDELIENLKRIPTEINSNIFISEIAEALEERIRNKIIS